MDIEGLSMGTGAIALRPHGTRAEPARTLGGHEIVLALDGDRDTAGPRRQHDDGSVRRDPLPRAKPEHAAVGAFGAVGCRVQTSGSG